MFNKKIKKLKDRIKYLENKELSFDNRILNMINQNDDTRKARDKWREDWIETNNQLRVEQSETIRHKEKIRTLDDVISTQTKVISCLSAKLKEEENENDKQSK